MKTNKLLAKAAKTVFALAKYKTNNIKKLIMEKKNFIGTLLIATSLAVTTSVIVSCSKKEGDAPTLTDEFLKVADANFKDYLLKNKEINTNGDDKISQEEVKAFGGKINCDGKGIKDLQGIEAFVGLTELSCAGNELEKLDLSKNTKLTKLDCSKNSKLQTLNIKIGDVEKLTELKATENPSLTCILVDDVDKAYLKDKAKWQKDAEVLYKKDCNEAIDPSIAKYFDSNKNLVIKDNDFKQYLLKNKEINVNGDGNISIGEVLSFNKTIDVTLAGPTNLEGIQAFKYLKELNCVDLGLEQLDVSNNIYLEKLDCNTNYLKQLDVSKNINLKELICYDNEFAQLDLSQNVNLKELNCSDNEFTQLDLSQNVKLQELTAGGEQLAELNISKNVNLVEFNFSGSLLTQIDLSKLIKLTEINIFYPPNLESINIKNGNNKVLEIMYVSDCPKLTCIQVDDKSYADAQPKDKWRIPSGAKYREDCSKP